MLKSVHSGKYVFFLHKTLLFVLQLSKTNLTLKHGDDTAVRKVCCCYFSVCHSQQLAGYKPLVHDNSFFLLSLFVFQLIRKETEYHQVLNLNFIAKIPKTCHDNKSFLHNHSNERLLGHKTWRQLVI